MILAYPKEEILSFRHHMKAKSWLKSELISHDEYDEIIKANPCKLYISKPAFKILFFLAALICVQGAVGLLVFMFEDVLDVFENFILPLWIVAISLFGLNEFIFIRDKLHYRSGLIQGVYYSALMYMLAAWFLLVDEVITTFYLGSTIFLFAIAIRYLDRLAILASILFFNAFVFLIFQGLEGNAQFLVPFVLAALNYGIFFGLRKLTSLNSMQPWSELIQLSKYLTLILAFLSVNLFVVQEGANEFLGLYGPIPFKGIFIALTIIIPLIYSYIGIKKRNKMFFRTGLVTLALGLASIKFYYSSGHTEFTLTATGIILFVATIWLIKRFKEAKNGITSKKLEGQGSTLLTVLMATHAQGEVGIKKQEGIEFGGGSFGGGGAGSDF